SIASAPVQTDELELCIVELEGGRGTHYLFHEAEVGTSIRFKGPEGIFILPAELPEELIFICTGTGVAPFRSMIRQMAEDGRLDRSVHLIFGTRYTEGILYRAEFAALHKRFPDFKYSVALSREEKLDAANFDFPVYSGYVHQIYEAEYASPAPGRRFYLCGWSNMIDEATKRLIDELGYAQNQVVYELYG
ncbi:MAG: FAD-dependent oxidoreductase, partial [Bacteroidota bacterium]